MIFYPGQMQVWSGQIFELEGKMGRMISRSVLAVVAGLFGVGLQGAVFAASGDGSIIQTRQQGIPHSAFLGLSFESGKGVAVGFSGLIAESEDGGLTWNIVDHGKTDLALLAVARHGDHTIAVGQLGVVMIKDAGEWKVVEDVTTSRLFGVSVNKDGLAFAVGEFGEVNKSTDGGKTWQPSRPDWAQYAIAESFGTGEPNIYAVDVSEAGVVTLAGEFGAMLRSVDQGDTWTVLRAITPKEPTIFAMHLVEEGQGNSYAVGQTGQLLISTDGGKSWQAKPFETDSNFLGVAATADGHVVLTGMRIMVRSTDNGRTWNRVTEGDTITDWYQAAETETQSGRIMAVGHSGKIIQIGGG